MQGPCKGICKHCGLEIEEIAAGDWAHPEKNGDTVYHTYYCSNVTANKVKASELAGSGKVAEPDYSPISPTVPAVPADTTYVEIGKAGPGSFITPATVVEIPPAPVAPKLPPDPKIGKGGGPTRATILPTDAAGRKKYPLATGLLDYFPDALAEVSHLSYIGNEQHNPGQPLHWARGKSTDHADTLMRHFVQRGTRDVDGVRHSVKVVWRALANLQEELEAEMKAKSEELPF
jgi:hypothetical protein